MQPIRSVEIIKVIRIIYVAGKGTEEAPNHIKTQYWSEEGQLLAESDD